VWFIVLSVAEGMQRCQWMTAPCSKPQVAAAIINSVRKVKKRESMFTLCTRCTAAAAAEAAAVCGVTIDGPRWSLFSLWF
jgi:hypothetical protein